MFDSLQSRYLYVTESNPLSSNAWVFTRWAININFYHTKLRKTPTCGTCGTHTLLLFFANASSDSTTMIIIFDSNLKHFKADSSCWKNLLTLFSLQAPQSSNRENNAHVKIKFGNFSIQIAIQPFLHGLIK